MLGVNGLQGCEYESGVENVVGLCVGHLVGYLVELHCRCRISQ
jgi:hypothetical protein